MSPVHPALEALPGEPPERHVALLRYAGLGINRKIAAFAREVGVCGLTVRTWAKKWNWAERIAKYDADVAAKENFDATKIRADAVMTLVRDIPQMIAQLRRLMYHKNVPASTRLAAIIKGLEIAGLIVKDKELGHEPVTIVIEESESDGTSR